MSDELVKLNQCYETVFMMAFKSLREVNGLRRLEILNYTVTPAPSTQISYRVSCGSSLVAFLYVYENGVVVLKGVGINPEQIYYIKSKPEHVAFFIVKAILTLHAKLSSKTTERSNP
jgi:hypothetical protein